MRNGELGMRNAEWEMGNGECGMGEVEGRRRKIEMSLNFYNILKKYAL
jgi:hypothetical protein